LATCLAASAWSGGLAFGYSFIPYGTRRPSVSRVPFAIVPVGVLASLAPTLLGDIGFEGPLDSSRVHRGFISYG
jgi:hypothetical protein